MDRWLLSVDEVAMTFTVPSSIHLSLSVPQTHQDTTYQVLTIDLTSPDRLIEPHDLVNLTLPAGIDTTGGVVINGRAPIWLYAHLVHELHPTAWVACYDPRLGGGVVVATHSRQTTVGQVVPMPQTPLPPRLGAALLIVGPPDSGKSVLSHALFQALLPRYPNVFLQRANWDGEGNWLLELPQESTADQQETFKRAFKGGPSERFFPWQAQDILALRRQKPLVLVDVGGKVQDTKLPLLDACSHYLVISSNPDAIEPWHEFCCDRANLKPVAVLHSTLERSLQVHRRQPFLEMTCGPWLRGATDGIPGVLLEQVETLLGGAP
jgi:CRISPR-associated protein Csx3